MLSNIGLYYPFIEFQSDAWVKLAALYWDKLGRMVLPEYNIRDSDTVQRLVGELDFIINFKPSQEEVSGISSKFYTLLEQNLTEFVKYYRISDWSEDGPIPIEREIFEKDLNEKRKYFQGWPDPKEMSRLWTSYLSELSTLRPAWILYQGRMTTELSDALINSGLALRLKQTPSLMGIHPRLACIYMEALAEEMSASRQLHPVTDTILEHLAISGCTLERLAQALFKHEHHINLFMSVDEKYLLRSEPTLTEHEIEVQMASVALGAVLPKNLAHIPIEKIIKLRKQHENELAAFQAFLHEFVANLSELQNIEDPIAAHAHLEVEYKKKLKPQLDNLKESLASLGIETVAGAMNVRVVLPALLASGGAYLAQTHLGLPSFVVGAGAVSLSIFPVIRDKRKVAADAIRSSPAAYLLYAHEGLQPATLRSWVNQHARKFLFRV